MENTLLTLAYWGAVQLVPLIYTIPAIPPDMKLMIYTILTPLLLSFISRQATFAGVNERVLISTGLAMFIMSYGISRAIKPIREALKLPSDEKNRLIFISSYIGMVIFYLMFMYGFSTFFGIYKNSPGAL